MKAIWNGNVAFGLINIPIRVYPASEEHSFEFHMLHKKDLSPIRFARICKEEEKEIAYSEIVKGYEYAKGEFVVVDEDDFKAANAKKTSTIEIQYFTDANQIHPIYYEKPYFLEPEKKAGRAYKLLSEALFRSNRVAVTTFVFRNREHLGVILPQKEGLLLLQMRYQSEIRAFEQLDLPQEKSSAAELKMALTIIEQLTQPFEPEKLHDTYVEELMALIQEKLKGKKKPKPSKAAKPSYEARDLMSLLQESMKKTVKGVDQKKAEKVLMEPLAKKKKQTRKSTRNR